MIRGSDANSNFVQSLYQLLLGRTGSAADVASWVSALKSGALNRQQVAFDFLSSAENRTDVVAGDYINLLHRSGAPAEIGGWVNSALDLFFIRIGFESSSEHSGLIVSTDYFSGPPADLITGRPPTFAGVTTINDLYAFRSPSNANNTVLIFNFQPFPGVITPNTADPNLTYEIHVNNANPLDGSDNLDRSPARSSPPRPTASSASGPPSTRTAPRSAGWAAR
jgi:hypothetical protein